MTEHVRKSNTGNALLIILIVEHTMGMQIYSQNHNMVECFWFSDSDIEVFRIVRIPVDMKIP